MLLLMRFLHNASRDARRRTFHSFWVHIMRSVVTLAISYFSIVFTVGFVLGVFRVLWLIPLPGWRAAELAEILVLSVIRH